MGSYAYIGSDDGDERGVVGQVVDVVLELRNHVLQPLGPQHFRHDVIVAVKRHTGKVISNQTYYNEMYSIPSGAVSILLEMEVDAIDEDLRVVDILCEAANKASEVFVRLLDAERDAGGLAESTDR